MRFHLTLCLLFASALGAQTKVQWIPVESVQKPLPREKHAMAYDLARTSVELDDTDDWSHWALGVVHLYRSEHQQAEAAYRKAIEINPNYADLLAHSGFLFTFVGKPEKAIDQIKTAMRLNPYYRAWYPSALGFACRNNLSKWCCSPLK